MSNEFDDEPTSVFAKDSTSSLYSQLVTELATDEQCIKEINLGKRIGFYRIRGEIGFGNFSQVKLGVHVLTKEKVAIKILDKTKLDMKTQRLLSREIASMEKLRHPNVIRLYEVVDTLGKLYMVMEYAGKGELFTKISENGRLQESHSKVVFAQIVAAVEHMHKFKVIHRDLKAENVFFANDQHLVKVGDFGFSTIVDSSSDKLTTFCGSPPYAAPELFQDDWYNGPAVDIWALGILLYFTVTGIMPFRADTVGKLKRIILDGIYSIPTYISPPCQHLIRRILRHTPTERFTIDEIKTSEWLANEVFPDEVRPYELNPSGGSSDKLNTDEIEARRILFSKFGISERHLDECSRKESRSSVTGSYRIVLHSVQKRRKSAITWDGHSGDGLDESQIIPKAKLESLAETPETVSSNQKQSRLCAIL